MKKVLPPKDFMRMTFRIAIGVPTQLMKFFAYRRRVHLFSFIENTLMLLGLFHWDWKNHCSTLNEQEPWRSSFRLLVGDLREVVSILLIHWWLNMNLLVDAILIVLCVCDHAFQFTPMLQKVSCEGFWINFRTQWILALMDMANRWCTLNFWILWGLSMKRNLR